MIKSILTTFDKLDNEVNNWIEQNPEYNIMNVNAVYCGKKILAIINYEEMVEECQFVDSEMCNGDCSNCDLDEYLLSGDN